MKGLDLTKNGGLPAVDGLAVFALIFPAHQNPQALDSSILSNSSVILVRSRAKHGEAFHLPGGKVEDGETPLFAIQREISEELGLNPTLLTFSLSHSSIVEGEAVNQPGKRFGQIFYVVSHDLKTPKPGALAGEARLTVHFVRLRNAVEDASLTHAARNGLAFYFDSTESNH